MPVETGLHSQVETWDDLHRAAVTAIIQTPKRQWIVTMMRASPYGSSVMKCIALSDLFVLHGVHV
jgi:hypothetical protein